MCLNRHKITNKYTGKTLYVDCGTCPACLQSKAIRRTNKIRYNAKSNYDCFFITLTYRSECIPYIRRSELKYGNPDTPYYYDEDCNIVRDIPVYRDYDVRYVRVGSSYTSQRKLIYNHEVPISSIPIQQSSIVGGTNGLPNFVQSIHNGCVTYAEDKIAIKYYPDVQNYIKKLRQILYRNYHVQVPFDYFICSEYGETSMRPHYHVLLFTERTPQAYELFKAASAKAWAFDTDDVSERRFERAIRPESYVATYVNCFTYLPSLFRSERAFRPQTSHSLHFGFGKYDFSFEAIYKAINNHNLRFAEQRVTKESLVVSDVLYPLYAIRRYFPKFAGYCWFNDYEAFAIYQRPDNLKKYKHRISLDDDVIQRNITMLKHKLTNAEEHGVNSYDFALACVSVNNQLSSEHLRDFYSDTLTIKDPLTAYDNIIDYYKSEVDAPTLDFYMTLPRESYPVDCNDFPRNIAKHNRLLQLFNLYDKSRKVRNYILSSTKIYF